MAYSDDPWYLLARISIAGNDYPSYSSLVEAENYHAGRLHNDVWTQASDDDKRKALVMASRVLDATYEWVGVRCNYSPDHQFLDWPREIATLVEFEDRYFDGCVIPLEIKHATAEMAMSLLAVDRTAVTDVAVGGIDKISVGTISLEFSEQHTASDSAQRPQTVPDYVEDLVSEFIATSNNAGGFGSLRLVRS